MLTDQEYYDMTEVIRSAYGDTIRGKKISDMSDQQIFAIAKSIMERRAVSKIVKRYYSEPKKTEAREYQLSIDDLKEAANV